MGMLNRQVREQMCGSSQRVDGEFQHPLAQLWGPQALAHTPAHTQLHVLQDLPGGTAASLDIPLQLREGDDQKEGRDLKDLPSLTWN